MFRCIVVGFDGSSPATRAYALGLELASRYQAQLHVISVARFPEPPDGQAGQT